MALRRPGRSGMMGPHIMQLTVGMGNIGKRHGQYLGAYRLSFSSEQGAGTWPVYRHRQCMKDLRHPGPPS